MKSHQSKLSICLLALIIFGCAQQEEPPASLGEANQTEETAPSVSSNETQKEAVESASTTPTDDQELVAKIEQVATAIKKNSNGVVTEINYRGSEVTDEHLGLLPGLIGLESLLLNEAKISDAALIPIGEINTLKNLDLRDCPIGNEGLEHLTRLENLKALRLSGKTGATTVDDDGMKSVAKLTNLKALLLDFLWVSGEGLAQLSELNSLEELYLAGTLVGDEDLAQVKLFPKLRRLRISKLSQVTVAGLEHVKSLENLIDLDLSENSSLFDPDMVHLSEMTKLEKLNLWRVAITDEGVKPLEPLTKMKWLNLDNTQLSDAGLKHLSGMQQLEFLHLGSTAITNDGLSELTDLKSLKDLKVTRTAVTEEGVAELQKSLPDTEIQLKYLGNGE